MQRCRILVINDFAEKGGAEEVYRQSAELLRAVEGVEVECFDQTTFCEPVEGRVSLWNFEAARALAKVMAEFKPHRVLVHNYHSVLSASVLAVIARYKRELHFTAYMTCHDFHLVYYNPNLLSYTKLGVGTLPLDALRTSRAFWSRSSPKGFAHDVLKKMHWHAMRMLAKPERIFDVFLCPSLFMQQALVKSRLINKSDLVFNPASVNVRPLRPKVCTNDRINLAFVGRVAAEKGLAQFIELAQSIDFARINRLTIYGDGPERETLEKRFASLIESGKVVFFGRLPQEKLFEELARSADAVVLPSVWPENAPLAIIEAALLGLPVLVNDIGSLSTFGDQVGNKIKFRSDPQALRQALDALAAHLSKPAREYDVREFSPAHYGKRLVQIMRINEQMAMAAS
jgi:glycosyltransferase involved in cell wall biosynthesis